MDWNSDLPDSKAQALSTPILKELAAQLGKWSSMKYASSTSWCKIICSTDILQGLRCSKCGSHVGESGNFREIDENSFWYSDAVAFFSMSSSSPPKNKVVELQEKLHVQNYSWPNIWSPALLSRQQFQEAVEADILSFWRMNKALSKKWEWKESRKTSLQKIFWAKGTVCVEAWKHENP